MCISNQAAAPQAFDLVGTLCKWPIRDINNAQATVFQLNQQKKKVFGFGIKNSKSTSI